MLLIGGGVHGRVYTPSHCAGHVVKLLGSRSSHDEFGKQSRVYESFSLLHSMMCGDRILDLVREHVRVAKLEPIQNEYSIVMEKLPSLPYHMMKDLVPCECNSIDTMLHLSFNNPRETRMIGVDDTQEISHKNPLRGFFPNGHDIDEMLVTLQLEHNLLLSSTTLREMIGFVYGWIYHVAKLVPIDIELTLGLCKDGNYCINVLDFGATRIRSEKDVCMSVMQAISDDEYIDLLGDSDAMRGFKKAFMLSCNITVYEG